LTIAIGFVLQPHSGDWGRCNEQFDSSRNGWQPSKDRPAINRRLAADSHAADLIFPADSNLIIMEPIAIISLVLSATAIGLSYYWSHKTHQASIMPVLVFSRKSETRWQIQNVGQGPALAIVVGDREKGGKWGYKVNFYPIAAGAEIELPWLNPSDELVASYKDVNGRAYSCVGGMSEEFYDSNKFPDLIPTTDELILRAMIAEYRSKF
jgi:hypothetical protein